MPMLKLKDPLEAALTGARIVEEVGDLLTLGDDPEALVQRAFQRLGQLSHSIWPRCSCAKRITWRCGTLWALW